jgi:hypothetical protein
MAVQERGEVEAAAMQLVTGVIAGAQTGHGNGASSGVTMVPVVSSPTPSTALPGASYAFALGWQMTELHNAAAATACAKLDRRLPSLNKLKERQGGAAFFLAQLETKLDRPELCLSDGRRQELTELIAKVRSASEARDQQHSADSEAAFASAVLALHSAMAGDLMAVDYKLAKAYSLGIRLAWITQWPSRGWKRAQADAPGAGEAALTVSNGSHAGYVPAPDSPEALKDAIAGPSMPGSGRIEKTIEQLGDLATVLPKHASRSVQLSLAAWSEWNEQRARQGVSVTLEQAHTLARQGEVWRSLLSGEKAGRDMLDVADYESAADLMFQRSGAIVRRFARVHRVAIGVLLLVIVAAVVLLLLANGASQSLAGIAALLASAGVTWKAASTALENVAVEIGRPMWAAEIDLALAKAITKLPPEEPRNTYDPSPPPRKRRLMARIRRERTPPRPDWGRILTEHPSSR